MVLQTCIILLNAHYLGRSVMQITKVGQRWKDTLHHIQFKEVTL